MFGLGARSANGALEMLDLPEPREPESGELVLDMLAAGIGPWDRSCIPEAGTSISSRLQRSA